MYGWREGGMIRWKKRCVAGEGGRDGWFAVWREGGTKAGKQAMLADCNVGWLDGWKQE
jgi:hypothetical protein